MSIDGYSRNEPTVMPSSSPPGAPPPPPLNGPPVAPAKVSLAPGMSCVDGFWTVVPGGSGMTLKTDERATGGGVPAGDRPPVVPVPG